MLNDLLVRVWTWFHREEGQDLVEYGLITGAISLVIVTAAALILVPAFSGWATGIGDALIP